MNQLLRTLSPVVMVPQNHACVVERFGRYQRTLEAGLHFKACLIDSIAYDHSLKETVVHIEEQYAITKDNVRIAIDGILYFRVKDAYKASYSVDKPILALSLLAQTSMRSEIGKILLDNTFQERESLNMNVRGALNDASEKWGIECMRYEIKDIKPHEEIKKKMNLESESERVKRAKVLKSEGEKLSLINLAEADKYSYILEGEGKAVGILQEAKSLVENIQQIADSIPDASDSPNQNAALQVRLTENYLRTLEKINSEVSILGLPEAAEGSQSQAPEQGLAAAMFLYLQKNKGSGGDVDSLTRTALEAAMKSAQRPEKALPEVQSAEAATEEQVVYYDDKVLYGSQN